MNDPQPNSFPIGRFQITSCATDRTATIAVLDTATGSVWVREVFGGNAKLLKREYQGFPLWVIPR